MSQVLRLLNTPWRVCSATLAFALSGCFATTRIDVEDNRVFLPAMRAAINLSQTAEPPSRVQTGHAIEFGVLRAKGSDSQTLSPGDSPIVLNHVTFSSPQELKNEFDFYFADVSWRWRKFFVRQVGLEILVGPSYTSLGLRVSSPTQSAFERFETWGPQGAIGVLWRVRDRTSFGARAGGFISAQNGTNRLTHSELFVAQAVGESLTLRASYAGWEVKGHALRDLSDFLVRFSGPVIALDLNF